MASNALCQESARAGRQRLFRDEVLSRIRTADLARTSCERMADCLDVSPATLRRYLSAFGLTWSAILNGERKRRCSTALSLDKDVSAEILARNCGLSGPDALYRAFPTWFGVSLEQWRANSSLPEVSHG